MKVAFIGLGNMGLPMSKNLVKANYEVYGLNRSKGREQLFAEAGGKTGYSLPELARIADVMMTCLPFPADVEEVFLGSDGIVANGHAGQILIDFSTVSPDLNHKIEKEAAKKGIEFLDAPVSGGNFGAESGTLSIMVGGKKEVFHKVYPLFEVLGKQIYHTGPVGSGTIIKLINQYMVGVHTQAASEAFIIGEKMGIDGPLMFDILNASYAQSRIFERHYTNFIAQNQFQAGFALKLLFKDLTLVQKMAEDNDINLPIGKPITSLFQQAKESSHGDKDMSAMVLYVKELQK
ncbi:NAD(P)-dependent oxidoreductase [Paenibacillus naphthalenovorans]|uniref:2-hydroxy-3-oxopropionate reductase n=1 Tax=Paenibacillus naphthalenovorans TaxID=162209 RepID=A0A0U2W3B6_9BACL|nr:NAD(P)-dependent oxidoreductase [Paenibacillus naphthalenovorans]ALS21885.1 2-hydroxy-3-oxopropionate reductase [Paenibacillus naphthalenovorans]GCL71614.1 NAD(P)-dependent oxidoreductase [Paenibacillus naphthalenovorans]